MPYKMKMHSVMLMNTPLKKNICSVGDEALGDTKSGKKAKKNI
jgi:hypothetical protein